MKTYIARNKQTGDKWITLDPKKHRLILGQDNTLGVLTLGNFGTYTVELLDPEVWEVEYVEGA